MVAFASGFNLADIIFICQFRLTAMFLLLYPITGIIHCLLRAFKFLTIHMGWHTTCVTIWHTINTTFGELMLLPSRLLLLSPLATLCFNANAAKPAHDVYSELGGSSISNGNTTTQAIHSKFGFYYYVTPFIALDVNWNQANSYTDGPKTKDFGSKYQGLGAAVKVQQPIMKNFSLYAKGGASYITFTESQWDNNIGSHVDTKESGLYPNASIGADMRTPWKNFSVNANYNYQMLQDDYNASTFSIGFNYHFK